MVKKRLKATLDELRDAVAGEVLDDQTRAQLEQVTAELEQLVERPEPLSQEEAQAASKRLNELLMEFEANHPKLTTAMQVIADGLAALGI